MPQGRKRRAWQILEKLALSAMVAVVFGYLQYQYIAWGFPSRPILDSAIWLLFLAIGIAAIWLTATPSKRAIILGACERPAAMDWDDDFPLNEPLLIDYMPADDLRQCQGGCH
jgi:hypothetical protein